ncbi:LytR/AlgR family response regulator transcription factor [Telluribacter humicola]|uniref:LytR/AlgR family response regulator transcription factor n=1 Tax=Telluribacter humicola TaxID=1720261 RepID=UPI001A9685D0|nr:LytTR family DNA-binding domain-containing protein [Telluribacter humicola]
MKVLLVEDEELAADWLRKILDEVEPTAVLAGITDSIESTVEWLQANPPPDLILMDIELADGQSFEIFNRVQVRSPVVFTTSYDEYAIRAFKVNSIDYLLKPVKRDELRASLEKLRHLAQTLQSVVEPPTVPIEQLIRQLSQPVPKEYRERFLLKSGNRYISLETGEIAYFYFENRLTFLRTWKDERYMVDYNLDELEEMLHPKTFFRANRQYILHIKSVKNIHSYFNHKLKLILQPDTEDEVLVSRERATAFKNWMGR